MGLPKRTKGGFLEQHAENLRDRRKVTGGGRPIFKVPMRTQVYPPMSSPYALTIFSGQLTAGAADLTRCAHGEADHLRMR